MVQSDTLTSSLPRTATNPLRDVAGFFFERRTTIIAIFTAAAIALHLYFRFGAGEPPWLQWPLYAALLAGGVPLVGELLFKLSRLEFGSDLLAGIAIVTSTLLGEYLAGALVVLMLSGGGALESFALRRASSVLAALAKRMPAVAHRERARDITDISLDQVAIGDEIVVFPHETCPVDGVVTQGHGMMDESYLTGEPFQMTKTVDTTVISGAVNGDSALTIRATQRAADSRYARIMEVMRESEQSRPHLRRLGDQLGAIYTPVALALAGFAWFISGDALRFLAVLVIATPCPLLIAIPVAIIGSISLCARRAIIVKSPVALEQISDCRIAIFDKTGTLTYGEPKLTALIPAPGFNETHVLTLLASLERYSKHPLARAVINAAEVEALSLVESSEAKEEPGQGLTGIVAGKIVRVTSRNKLLAQPETADLILPSTVAGLECIVLIDNVYAATLQFRDAPRSESRSFIAHLGPKHQFERVMILSGDRESEVRYLSEQVGIEEVHAQQSPEQKLAIVRAETARANTLYVGDGINDAPAMMASTVGIALGQNSDVTSQAASVVIMDSSLKKVDEFFHIGRRMRTIALQSAVGGMALSLGGMIMAAGGDISPVSGALAQEVIDVLAVLNALRAAFVPRTLNGL